MGVKNQIKSNGTRVLNPNIVKPKSKFWAYFWWLFGGFLGAHHWYLERDNQALIWFGTGGCFGIGWLRDLYRIPTYVADANNQREYVYWFKYMVQAFPKPPFKSARWLGALAVSYLFGLLVYVAIPEDEVNGINFRHLMVLIPLFVAYGTWLVGNVGREEGTIWVALIASYTCYPSLYYIGDVSTWLFLMSIASTICFDTYSKRWRLNKTPKKSLLRRLSILLLFVLIFGGLWANLWFNATITDSEGEKIRISESIKHLFTSPLWLDFKTSLRNTWTEAQNQGFWATWYQLIDLSDPHGEINAYKVLGLSITATQSEITTKWRALSREHHPDKVKGTEEERRAAQLKFMEIQQAHEILSSSKSRRQRKNTKSDPA